MSLQLFNTARPPPRSPGTLFIFLCIVSCSP
jgi:hypothetical protein